MSVGGDMIGGIDDAVVLTRVATALTKLATPYPTVAEDRPIADGMYREAARFLGALDAVGLDVAVRGRE